MDTRLYEASIGGDVNSLVELLEQDPLLLHRVITSFHETPLHIAVISNHVDFAKKILSIKPELASEVDLQGLCTPLHVASTGTNVEMVNVLLRANPDVCSVINGDGRLPLHLAVIKGRIEIVKLLIRTRPETVRVLTNGTETILHLCARYNRLEVLKLLVPTFMQLAHNSSEDQAVVSINSLDDDGNTILHLAVARKQIQMIKYLLKDNLMGVEAINTINKNGYAALDILSQNLIKDIKDIEIGDLLRNAGALSAREQQLAAASSSTWLQPLFSLISSRNERYLENDNWLTKKHSALMVVASLIATMAFQAGLNPPSGVWQDNSEETKHSAGTSIMADYAPRIYILFMISNTTGFLASLSVILLLISGLPLKRRFFVWLLTAIMWIAITSTASTYIIALICISAQHITSPLKVLKGLFFAWIGFMCVIVFVHILRLLSWLLWKSGIIPTRVQGGGS
ncbi:hypothetical protein MKW98_031571 [Papaver atlanticum]|uniref:PGG domain-containing protein n=1 Tax=Papaver atlanticum TaxID=357466 RepID=A0AAD4X9F6_9MAGN|nr:hypothetical protein MKW98_031571 [Papaver atlanticum]